MRHRPVYLAIVLACALVPRAAGADDYAQQLTTLEEQARDVGANLPMPNAPPTNAPKRLTDAQVAYSLGDYDAAALILFDLVGTSPQITATAQNETAIYYLAETLYHKGDRGAAHAYFTAVAANPGNRHYQQALERLVEIGIVQNDPSGVDDYLAKLPASPYIHGKWLFAQKKYDDAINFFTAVPKGDQELQAQYYLGASYVAKQDLAKATEIYSALVDRKPHTAGDRRVIELAQLALGRIYYEREQPAKSIDAYLLVDRHSDLFADALYEVSWVYVKSKQYDKALRALELLEQQDPTSTKTSTTRILEGNLRIRKAQMLRTAQVNGTFDINEKDDPATEYEKATQIFAETHDQYYPVYLALSRMVDSGDPSRFVEQIAGRQTRVFTGEAPLPEAAAQWLRDEPAIQRVVAIETDLAFTQSQIDQTEAMIARLDGVLAAGAKANAYPQLAARRSRAALLQVQLIKVRSQLADTQLALVGSGGDLAQLAQTRKQLIAQYAALGNPEDSSARIQRDNETYDKLDDSALEVEGALGSTQAMAVAVRKYADDAKLPDEQRAVLQKELEAAAKDAQGIEDELAAARREIALGRDLAHVVDEGVIVARDLRTQIKTAQDAEQRAQAGFASASRDRNQSQNLVALGDRASRLADQLAQLDQQIDQRVEQGLAQVRTTIDGARKDLEQYKQELAQTNAEAQAVGGAILAASFKDVKDRFYDVVIRSDVGTVDVAWSQKEDTDDDLKRLNLARQREVKQLKDEFRDILEVGLPAPAPKKAAPQPTADRPPATSPDSAGATPGSGRVNPGDTGTRSGTTPTVKPDEPKPATPDNKNPKKGAKP